MRIKTWLASTAGATVLLIATAAPAFAQSDTDRARTAIVEARAKIDAAIKVGATGEAPHYVAQAQSSLRAAEEDLARSHEKDAIEDAHRASRYADEALGVAEQNKSADAAAEREARLNAESAAMAERARSASAETAATAARESAADANARAEAAQQAATASANEAALARATPPPAPVTTVTVERETAATVTRAPVAKRKVVRRAATTRTTVRPTSTTKTTTTVTTTPQ